MSDIVKKAEKLLAGLAPVDYPFSFVGTGPGDPYNMPGAITGSLRSKGGRAVVVPLPESASSLAAFPGTIEFFTQAPQVMEDLVTALKKAESASEGSKEGKKD